MTTTLETPPVAPDAPSDSHEQTSEPTIAERRAALMRKFGQFANHGNMSDRDVEMWFKAAGLNKSEDELIDELTRDPMDVPQESAANEKKNGLIDKVTLVPRAVLGIPTMAEMEAYQNTQGAQSIEEARELYENADNEKLTVVGRINNKYMLNVLKRAEKRAARSERYNQKIQRREGESIEQHAKRMRFYELRRRVSVGLGVAAGAALYLGSRGMHDYHWIHDQVSGGGGSHDAANLLDAHDQTTPDQQHIDTFKYDHNLDPFYQPGKEGIHDFGAALRPDAADGNKPAGWADWTNTRLVKSPEQLASIATGMNIDGQQDSNMNPLAEQFKDPVNGPKLMAHFHDEVVKLLNDPNTKVHEEPITGPFASLYEWDQNGDGVLARDDYVDQRGTKMVIEFGPPNNRQVMEIRKECGGQRIWAPVIPVQHVHYSTPQGGGSYTPVSYSRPQGGSHYTAPQGNGNYTPPTQQQPPAEQPPTQQPPTEQPPTEQPPQEQPPLQAKEPTHDINVNPGLPEIIKMGIDRMGSGALQAPGEVHTPPSTYSSPLDSMGSRPASPGSVAPGANASPGSLGQHSQAPAAQAGSTGTAANGNHETGRVSE